MQGSLEILKICFVGILIVLGIYFLPDISVDFSVPEAQADIATTSVSVANVAPSVSSVDLNAGANIDLAEDTTVTVNCAATLSDANGGGDITSATSTIYRSGVGDACTADDNNCYQIASGNCTLGAVAGNDRPATCTADIWFHADPTNIGSPWATEEWVCRITATDAVSNTGSATNTGQTIEMNTLRALDVSPTIGYDTLTPGQTQNCNVTTTATTTGNAAIDADISGVNMCTDYPTCSGNAIGIGQQHYATSSVAYASGYTASITATPLEFDTVKPTAHPSDQVQNTFWGIAIPSVQPAANYTGENTYTATAD